MTWRMLDTNTIGYIMRANRPVLARLAETSVSRVCASAVTEGEVRYGIEKRGPCLARRAAIDGFFETIQILPWTGATARIYGKLRADLHRLGRPLAPLDMMIAAHAIEAGAVLVTSDRALLSTPGLTCENWLAP